MNESPLVSVILTFYNQCHLVQRALGSVVGQTYQNLDVIVVDDGSTDDVPGEVRRFDDSRIRFFRQENGGVAMARNLGIREARGEYIAFLDGDDAYLPRKIEVLVKRLKDEGFPQCVIVSGYYVVSSRGRIVGKQSPAPRMTDPETSSFSNFPDMRPSMILCHAGIFKDFGGFPAQMRINEDGAFNQRLYRNYPIICIPDVLVLWQGDDEGKSRKVLRTFDSALRVMEQKIAYIREWLGEEWAEESRRSHLRNNLCGFLSVRNPVSARQWYGLVQECDVPLDSWGSKLAAFSVRTGVNFYAAVRWLLKGISTIRLLGTSWRLRHQLRGWSNKKYCKRAQGSWMVR